MSFPPTYCRLVPFQVEDVGSMGLFLRWFSSNNPTCRYRLRLGIPSERVAATRLADVSFSSQTNPHGVLFCCLAVPLRAWVRACSLYNQKRELACYLQLVFKNTDFQEHRHRQLLYPPPLLILPCVACVPRVGWCWWYPRTNRLVRSTVGRAGEASPSAGGHEGHEPGGWAEGFRLPSTVGLLVIFYCRRSRPFLRLPSSADLPCVVLQCRVPSETRVISFIAGTLLTVSHLRTVTGTTFGTGRWTGSPLCTHPEGVGCLPLRGSSVSTTSRRCCR